MIMPAGRPLLLPIYPPFIALTLFAAALLTMLMELSGQIWLPDLLALTLAFWVVHQPRRIGMLTAFVLGLFMDVHEAALLGQNAMSYVLLCFLSLHMHRRLLSFPAREQAIQMLAVFLLSSACEWITRAFVHDGWPSWQQVLGPFLQALLWPLADGLLLAPQRRPYNPDDIRPL